MPFKIAAAHVTNLKAIREADLSGLGSLVIIGGANGAGKSGLIGILAGLVGHGWPDDLLRDGTKKGEAECRLVDGDEVFRVHVAVTRKGGPKVTITQVVTVSGEERELPISRPRAWLKRQLGTDSADILDNIDQFNKPVGERAVLEQLRDIAGLDFSDLDGEAESLRQARRVDNGRLSDAEARRDAIPRGRECPTEEVSVTALVEELTAENRRRLSVEQVARRIQTNGEEARRLRAQLDEYEKVLREQRQELHALEVVTSRDPEDIQADIDAAGEVNGRVRAQTARKEHVATVAKLDAQVEDATKRLDAIAERKRAMLATAEFGVDGLTLSDDLATILYEGEPLRRLSDGNKFAVFAMLAAAQNPGIGVLFSTRASLLDPEHLAFCHETAEAMGMQLIFEIVGEREGAIVIEAAEGGSIVKGTENG